MTTPTDETKLRPQFDQVLEDKDSGLWVVWRDGEVVARGDTRDRAIFWAGWWTGRHELAESTRYHAYFGESADQDHHRGPPPQKMTKARR